ncbi:MAG: Dam family site-specific DNA-(adenine-N6)-methyltransferase [Coriobacteriales bacterium]|jgi:DNA adenine methylase|nr:Dam family site-specific DNA-(adenine-N6)-methyltransferase [Coriobacteriales bacterium]
MVKYRGGKSREVAEMMPFIPGDYERYIEPFFGGGALYFCLMPRRAIINDLNSKLMSFYSGVRDSFSSLSSELQELETKYLRNRMVFDEEKRKAPEKRVCDPNEELYYSIRDMFNGKRDPEYSDAALYYFINKTAYSGMIRYNSSGDYNVPYGRYKNFNTRLVTETHATLLKNAEVSTGDYQNIFNLCTSKDFVFLDPPYDCVFSDYGNKETRAGFNETEHRRLQEAFYSLPCKALMVMGETDLIHELYKDSIIHRYEKSYAVNIRNRFKSESNHILVANYRMVE